MDPHRPRGAVLAACLVLSASGTGVAGSPPPDRALVPWTHLEFTARKVGETATILVDVREVAVADAERQWLELRGGFPVRPAASTAVLVEAETRLASRVIRDRLWLDGATGAAVQVDDSEAGHNVHATTYRLCRNGFATVERLPAAGEASQPPEAWSKVTRGWHEFPADLAGESVTGAMGLLWLAAATPSLWAGDPITVPVIVRGQVERITISALGPAVAEVDMIESKGGVETHVRGLVPAVRASLVATPVAAEAESRFRVFGLGGEVQILWDPQRGVPLELAGDVRLLGHLAIRLTRAELR